MSDETSTVESTTSSAAEEGKQKDAINGFGGELLSRLSNVFGKPENRKQINSVLKHGDVIATLAGPRAALFVDFTKMALDVDFQSIKEEGLKGEAGANAIGHTANTLTTQFGMRLANKYIDNPQLANLAGGLLGKLIGDQTRIILSKKLGTPILSEAEKKAQAAEKKKAEEAKKEEEKIDAKVKERVDKIKAEMGVFEKPEEKVAEAKEEVKAAPEKSGEYTVEVPAGSYGFTTTTTLDELPEEEPELATDDVEAERVSDDEIAADSTPEAKEKKEQEKERRKQERVGDMQELAGELKEQKEEKSEGQKASLESQAKEAFGGLKVAFVNVEGIQAARESGELPAKIKDIVAGKESGTENQAPGKTSGMRM